MAEDKKKKVEQTEAEKYAATKQAERDALPKLDIDNPKHGNKTYDELAELS